MGVATGKNNQLSLTIPSNPFFVSSGKDLGLHRTAGNQPEHKNTLIYANEEFCQNQVIVEDDGTETESEADMLRAGSSLKDVGLLLILPWFLLGSTPPWVKQK